MADLVITEANMLPATGSVVQDATAAVAVAIGKSVYFDETTNKWSLADANGTAITAGSGGCGIATSGAAGNNQVFKKWSQGSLAFGAILTVGQIYCVSRAAGMICPYGDLIAGDYVTILGVATTTSNLASPEAGIFASGALKP